MFPMPTPWYFDHLRFPVRPKHAFLAPYQHLVLGFGQSPLGLCYVVAKRCCTCSPPVARIVLAVEQDILENVRERDDALELVVVVDHNQPVDAALSYRVEN